MKESTNDPRREILASKNPINFYIVVTFILALLVFFVVLAWVERMDWRGTLFCFLIFGGIIYGSLGRYLARITLYNDRLEVNYIFPWNRPILFEYRSIESLERLDNRKCLQIIKSWRHYLPGYVGSGHGTILSMLCDQAVAIILVSAAV